MKIHIPIYDRNGIGGGWSFLRNLEKGLKSDCYFVDNLCEADILFIAGPTLAIHEIVESAERLGKPIVLRVDNIPEDYRNRGTALSRLKIFSEKADVVVYQSEWARGYVGGYTGVDGTVIYNGVDKNIFKPTTNKIELKDCALDKLDALTYTSAHRVLYVRSSTNESKRWQEAKYFFREMWLKNRIAKLSVVGNFGDYVKLYGDDFIGRYTLGAFDEPIEYLGQLNTAEQMAKVMRNSDEILISFYNDACSNVVLEARACGLKINTCLSGMTGGTPELLNLPIEDIGIDRMAADYLALFNLVLNS